MGEKFGFDIGGEEDMSNHNGTASMIKKMRISTDNVAATQESNHGPWNHKNTSGGSPNNEDVITR